MRKEILNITKGVPAMDGAGVKLTRVLGHSTVEAYDPFLMLSSIDSKNPADYEAGFPFHPHRGIETVTYLSKGSILHRDSMGNEGLLAGGGIQWMTTGKGLLHEELPQVSEEMVGIQLWLNLPAKDKYCESRYRDFPASQIPHVLPQEGVDLAVMAGEWGGIQGLQGEYLPLQFYSLKLAAGTNFELKVQKTEDSSFLFLLKGDVEVNGQLVQEKSAVLLSQGDTVQLMAAHAEAEVLYLSAPRLDEPVVWGGPVVLNTREELRRTFEQLQNGTFLQ